MRVCSGLSVLWLVLFAGVAVGQDAVAGPKVAVLRATSGMGDALVERVDGALLRDLAQIAGIESPTVAPVDYAEIQLAVGCSEASGQCLSQVAQMLEVDAVVVRRLDRAGDDATLELTYFEPSAADDPTVERAVVPAEQGEALVEAVAGLVRKLFGVADPVAVAPPVAPEAARAESENPDSLRLDQPTGPARSPQVSPWTWVTLGAGASLLTAGLVVGADASADFDEFKAQEIRSPDMAERAAQAFEELEDRALIANILVPAGAVVLGVGATLLVLDLGEEEGQTQLGVRPLGDGAFVQIKAKLGGM